eukprot:TRINITY_DN12773_c0_g1_i2.p1 TRINITY_DN12773_c0_g1~~TRINITY_DN12773_c0_g1_i2.p1  ORF type:complete len:871 (+),score=80.25 TRINITY_DN12773_c0_g1_i2:70-2613(+)
MRTGACHIVCSRPQALAVARQLRRYPGKGVASGDGPSGGAPSPWTAVHPGRRPLPLIDRTSQPQAAGKEPGSAAAREPQPVPERAAAISDVRRSLKRHRPSPASGSGAPHTRPATGSETSEARPDTAGSRAPEARPDAESKAPEARPDTAGDPAGAKESATATPPESSAAPARDQYNGNPPQPFPQAVEAAAATNALGQLLDGYRAEGVTLSVHDLSCIMYHRRRSNEQLSSAVISYLTAQVAAWKTYSANDTRLLCLSIKDMRGWDDSAETRTLLVTMANGIHMNAAQGSAEDAARAMAVLQDFPHCPETLECLGLLGAAMLASKEDRSPHMSSVVLAVSAFTSLLGSSPEIERAADAVHSLMEKCPPDVALRGSRVPAALRALERVEGEAVEKLRAAIKARAERRRQAPSGETTSSATPAATSTADNAREEQKMLYGSMIAKAKVDRTALQDFLKECRAEGRVLDHLNVATAMRLTAQSSVASPSSDELAYLARQLDNARQQSLVPIQSILQCSLGLTRCRDSPGARELVAAMASVLRDCPDGVNALDAGHLVFSLRGQSDGPEVRSMLSALRPTISATKDPAGWSHAVISLAAAGLSGLSPSPELDATLDLFLTHINTESQCRAFDLGRSLVGLALLRDAGCGDVVQKGADTLVAVGQAPLNDRESGVSAVHGLSLLAQGLALHGAPIPDWIQTPLSTLPRGEPTYWLQRAVRGLLQGAGARGIEYNVHLTCGYELHMCHSMDSVYLDVGSIEPSEVEQRQGRLRRRHLAQLGYTETAVNCRQGIDPRDVLVSIREALPGVDLDWEAAQRQVGAGFGQLALRADKMRIPPICEISSSRRTELYQ